MSFQDKVGGEGSHDAQKDMHDTEGSLGDLAADVFKRLGIVRRDISDNSGRQQYTLRASR